jgi:hypothetical protein
MNVTVSVRVAGDQSVNRGVRRGVELNNSLHWQRLIDEKRRLVVDVFHLDDHPLILDICGLPNKYSTQMSSQNKTKKI